MSYTDPYCTWCWGSEPVLRRIQETYGPQVAVSFVMGGLVADIARFRDPANDIGGPDWERQVAAHWLEASARHGMPVDVGEWSDLGEHFSTYPANIAVKAAQLQDQVKADRYLRRLREAAATEARPIHRIDEQARLAEEVGLDPGRLVRDVEGPARQAFEADLDECRAHGVRGFPTFLIRNAAGDERMLRGYHSFDAFTDAFGQLAGTALRQRDLTADGESILSFVAKYGKVAPREVAEVFGLSDDAAAEALAGLVAAGALAEQAAGNGSLYRTA